MKAIYWKINIANIILEKGRDINQEYVIRQMKEEEIIDILNKVELGKTSGTNIRIKENNKWNNKLHNVQFYSPKLC